jgi:hypothetical protein
MPITFTTNPNTKTLSVTFQDWRGQRRLMKIKLIGTVANTAIEAFLEDLEAVTNARILKAEVLSEFEASGMGTTATDAPNPEISNLMALNFTAINPLNAAKRVNKSVLIPAFIRAIESTNGSGAAFAAQPNLAAIITFFEAGLAYTAANGSHYGNLFDYAGGQHISAAEIVDNR